MDLTSADNATTAFCESCVCGRTFSQPGALHYHTRSCPQAKKQLLGVLTKAKDVFIRKRRRLDTLAGQPNTSQEMESVASQIFDSPAINPNIDVSDLISM